MSAKCPIQYLCYQLNLDKIHQNLSFGVIFIAILVKTLYNVV